MGGKTEAYISSAVHLSEDKLTELSEKTGITVYIISGKEITDNP